MEGASLLSVRDLKLRFYTERGIVHALNGVNLSLEAGQVIGVVGETGCGKSMLARSILRLIPGTARITGGSIHFEGIDTLRLRERDMRRLRGGSIGMVFQEPASALNPVIKIGDQILESINLHGRKMRKREARERMLGALSTVGMPNPVRTSGQYMHELSGGMQQRAIIALALSTGPKLLIADEPTTALDVTIQAQILELLRSLRDDGVISSILLVSHDFGIVADLCEYVAVMYAGVVVEFARIEDIFDNPSHPYTQGLFAALPQRRVVGESFGTIPGSVPSVFELPKGCAFATRCPHVIAHVCSNKVPQPIEVEPSHWASCFLRDSRFSEAEGS